MTKKTEFKRLRDYLTRIRLSDGEIDAAVFQAECDVDPPAILHETEARGRGTDGALSASQLWDQVTARYRSNEPEGQPPAAQGAAKASHQDLWSQVIARHA